MSLKSETVLVTKNHYNNLEEVLQNNLPKSGMIYNVLKIAQTLNEGSKIKVAFYSDRNVEQWSVDTTTFMGVINVVGLPKPLITFNNPVAGTNKHAILQMLDILDWGKELQFEGVDNATAPVLLEAAKKRGNVHKQDPIGLFYLTKEEALEELLTKKDLSLINGPKIYGSSLRPEDAEFVQERLDENTPGYLEMLQASIELVSSGGIYKRHEDDQGRISRNLVSFAVALPFGSIHALYTEPNQRRKGYGQLTLKVLARNIAKAGRIPLVQIDKDNGNSLVMNEGVAFKYIHDVNLIIYTPEGHESTTKIRTDTLRG